MPVKIQIRRDTAANWTASNPRLASGEFGYETNTGKLKIGNGTSTWSALSYFAGSGTTTATGGADSDWVLRQTPKVQADSDWIIRTIKRLDVDSDWITRNFKEKADSDWITRNFKEKADSDWVIRTIKRLDVDSDWITKQLYTKTQVDSDLLSKTQVTNTFYVNTGGDSFIQAIAKVGTSPAKQIILPPGSIGATANVTTLTNASTLAITAPANATSSASTEILGKVILTGTTSTRVRFSNVSFDSEFELNGTLGRHTFKGVTFQKFMRITGSTTNFLTFEDCSFDGGFVVPNTFAGVIYLVRCTFNGIAPTLGQSSPLQVIFSDCSGLPSFPTNASLFANNALATAYTRWTGNELRVGGKTINGNLDSDWVGRQVLAGGFTSGVQGAHLTFGGYHINEKFTTLTANPSGATALDTAANSLFYVAGTSNAWSVNMTNVNIAIGESCAVTIVCNNGATANFPSSWSYNGTIVVARNLNGVVYTANPNKYDIINATLMRLATSTYLLTVSLSSYA